MRILRNTITIIAEFVVLILATLWYIKTKDYEPLIVLILSSVGLLTSLLSKFMVRPKIVLHRRQTDWGRLTKGYTSKNPPIIRLGIDIPNQYWELFWNHILEIRNNSSQTAYSIDIKYLNTPESTFINGEIGKIEPLIANDKREFKIKIVQNTTGSHLEADEYLKANIKDLMNDAQILVKYEDEYGSRYYTTYNWSTDSNKFEIIKNKTIKWLIIVCLGLLILIIYIFQNNVDRNQEPQVKSVEKFEIPHTNDSVIQSNIMPKKGVVNNNQSNSEIMKKICDAKAYNTSKQYEEAIKIYQEIEKSGFHYSINMPNEINAKIGKYLDNNDIELASKEFEKYYSKYFKCK